MDFLSLSEGFCFLGESVIRMFMDSYATISPFPVSTSNMLVSRPVYRTLSYREHEKCEQLWPDCRDGVDLRELDCFTRGTRKGCPRFSVESYYPMLLTNSVTSLLNLSGISANGACPQLG
jgi:hypothetical protein